MAKWIVRGCLVVVTVFGLAAIYAGHGIAGALALLGAAVVYLPMLDVLE